MRSYCILRAWAPGRVRVFAELALPEEVNFAELICNQHTPVIDRHETRGRNKSLRYEFQNGLAFGGNAQRNGRNGHCGNDAEYNTFGVHGGNCSERWPRHKPENLKNKNRSGWRRIRFVILKIYSCDDGSVGPAAAITLSQISRRSTPIGQFSPPMTPKQKDELAALVRRQIELIGEKPGREGLLRTPERVAHSMAFLTSGYESDPMTVLNDALFDGVSDEMVIVKDIDFYSLCEHHMLPFFGKCHIAYLPRKKVIGLSKLPRLVDVFARRLQIQERMTFEIATTVKKLINAQGVGVVIEAQHLCMIMRGVEKQNSYAITSSMLGGFRTDSRTRAEFLELIRHKRNGL